MTNPFLRFIALWVLSFSVLALPEDGSQFTEHDQINSGNIGGLELAFSFSTGDLGLDFASKGHSFQTTPVYWNGALYFSTSSNEVIAIDAANGALKWRYDPKLDRDVSYSESASRGVALWHSDSKIECTDRVIHGTLDGHLHVLDAKTGELCSSFAANGVLDLGSGIQNRRVGEYSVTSPVAVLKDRIIVGSSIGDNGATDLEQGIVRALDPITGKLLWQWDPIPRDRNDPAAITWRKESASVTGAANAWAPISVDPQLNLVFVPTSSPSPDFYGGERHGKNHYSDSIVAIDATTGEIRWFQQLVHHDIWDYDTPGEPSLTTIRQGDLKIPAVVIGTKTGMVFAFNRVNGEPIYPIVEKAVPQTDVPGEESHPTQPFSSVILSSHAAVKDADMFGMVYFDKVGCRETLEASRSEGIFTPPSLEGTVQFPGWGGGMNWGGIALDGERQIAIVNFMNLAGLIKLLPRAAFNEAVESGSMPGWQLTAMRGTPYGMARKMFLSSLGLPCTKPPWGEIAAINLSDGSTLWRRPLGSVEDLSPIPTPNRLVESLMGDWGVPSHGGPLMTSSGITFIGATLDFYFRGLKTETGEELWRYRLETSANATPMSYIVKGKQYVAIAVGGHTGAGTPRGDKLLIFALPE